VFAEQVLPTPVALAVMLATMTFAVTLAMTTVLSTVVAFAVFPLVHPTVVGTVLLHGTVHAFLAGSIFRMGHRKSGSENDCQS
jgi:hypothetical protein